MHLPILHVDRCITIKCLYACQVFEIKTNFAGILARRVDAEFLQSMQAHYYMKLNFTLS